MEKHPVSLVEAEIALAKLHCCTHGVAQEMQRKFPFFW